MMRVRNNSAAERAQKRHMFGHVASETAQKVVVGLSQCRVVGGTRRGRAGREMRVRATVKHQLNAWAHLAASHNIV